MTTMATGQKSYNCQEDSDIPVADNYIILQDYIDCCQEEVIYLSKIPKIPTLCACGCNEIVWNGKQYRNQHWQRGKKRIFSVEHRKHLSEGQKGRNAWNKGIPQSDHQKNEHSKRMIGHIPWNKGCKGVLSESALNKMSLAKKGKPIKHFVDNKQQIAQKISNALKGRTILAEWRTKISKTLKGKYIGEAHPLWTGGKKIAWARQHNRRKQRGCILLINNNPYNEPIDYHHIHPKLPYVVPCPTRIHQMFAGCEKSHFHNVNAMLGFRFEEVILL